MARGVFGVCSMPDVACGMWETKKCRPSSSLSPSLVQAHKKRNTSRAGHLQQLRIALDKLHLSHQHVLVLGSQHPSLEASVLGYGARFVTSVLPVNTTVSPHPQLRLSSYKDWRRYFLEVVRDGEFLLHTMPSPEMPRTSHVPCAICAVLHPASTIIGAAPGAVDC